MNVYRSTRDAIVARFAVIAIFLGWVICPPQNVLEICLIFVDCIYDSAIAGRGPRLRPENVKGATYKNLLPAPTKPNQPTDKDLSTTGRLHGGTKLDIQMKESADKKLLNQDYSSAKLFTAINDVDGTNVHDEQTIPPTKVSQISYFTETKNESFLPQIKGSFMQAVQPKLSYTHKAIVSEHSEHGGSNESLGNF